MFSKSNLQGAHINHDPRGWGIDFIYGIVTPASIQKSKEVEEFMGGRLPKIYEAVYIGDRILKSDDLKKELKLLNEKTRRDYAFRFIAQDEDVEEFIAIVGVDVPSLMHAYGQEHHGLVEYVALKKIFEDSSIIIKDLETLGFRDITEKDLYLDGEAYRH